MEIADERRRKETAKDCQDAEKHLVIDNRRIFMKKKKRLITPAKPQAATQAITPSLRPRPSYPLVEIKEVVCKATCKKLTAPNFIASKLSSFARGL